jgi:hypothetical protein
LTHYQKIPLCRDCNLCHPIEGPTADALFHKVKFELRKTFVIAFDDSRRQKADVLNPSSEFDFKRFTQSLIPNSGFFFFSLTVYR